MENREDLCGICGHYHKDEPCGVCGHRLASESESSAPASHVNDFATEILPGFLYLGAHENPTLTRARRLRILGITHILNTFQTLHNVPKYFFTYHTVQQQDKTLPIDEAVQYLEQCKKNNARVLVLCMNGKNRGPALVMAYLMKSNGWKLAESYQWVKQRKPNVELTQAFNEQLQQYEQRIFGSTDGRPNDQPVPVPALNNDGSSTLSDNLQELTLGS